MRAEVAAPLSHSRLQRFRACPRRDYIRSELRLKPERDELQLRVGTAFHLACDALDRGLDIESALATGIEDPYDLALVAAMFDAHRRRWEDEHLEPIATELSFDMPLVNPKTGASTPIWRLVGTIDRIVRLADGRLALMERKTTSQDFSPGADYWLRLHLDQQLSIYVIAARQLGYDIETVLYDVTRRPGQRPSQVPIVDENGSKIVLGPDGARVRTADGKKWRETGDSAKDYVLQTRPETPEEFSARVASVIAAAPEQYFARIEIARLDQDLDDCRAELWQQQLAIRAAQRNGHWYRNPEACFGHSFTCDYVAICANRDLETNTPAGFARSRDVVEGDAARGGEPAHATALGQASA